MEDKPEKEKLDVTTSQDLEDLDTIPHWTKSKTYRKVYMYSKTAVLTYSWICLGLYSEVLGPSLPSLMARCSINYEEVGRALTTRASGYFIGSLGGGFIMDRYQNRRPLFLTLALLLAAVASISVIFARDLIPLAVVFFFGGIAHGVHTTGGNPSLAELWLERASGPFNLLHAGYGLGGAVAPMILKSFTRSFQFNQTENGTLLGLLEVVRNSTDPLTNTTQSKTSYEAVLLLYPFGIVALCCLICAALFLCFVFLPNPMSSPPSKSSSSPSFCAIVHHSVNRNTIGYLLLAFFTYTSLVGSERVFGKFLFSYARDSQLQIATSQAYTINTVYWTSFCLARMLTFLLALKLPVQGIYLGQLVGTLVAAIGLNVAPGNRLVFYVFFTLYGSFKSPLFPTGLAVLNRYMEVTGLVTLVVNVGSAVGAMLLQYLAGNLIENLGQPSFLHIIVGTAVILILLGSSLLILGRVKGERFSSNQETGVPLKTSANGRGDEEIRL